MLNFKMYFCHKYKTTNKKKKKKKGLNLIENWEISKALGCSKTIICNYLKSPNKYGTRKPTGRPEKLSPQFKRRIVCEVKKKTSST